MQEAALATRNVDGAHVVTVETGTEGYATAELPLGPYEACIEHLGIEKL